MAVTAITSVDQLKQLAGGKQVVVVHFWADWSKPCSQTTEITQKLAQKHPNLLFAQVEAEKVPDVTEQYNVLSVPHFVFLREGATIDQLEGVNVPVLNEKVIKYAKESPAGTPAEQSQATPQSKSTLESRLEKLINFAPVMLFMKGTPDAPRCGFSSKIVALLRQEKIQFSSFDILSDEEVRQGLKEHSKWPTFPQLYIEGKLIGGLDIVKELIEQKELEVPASAKVASLNDRLGQLINSQPVMVFMKGSPETPQCGFSAKLVDILNKEGVKFGSFNILADEEVRQGLKTYSNWPTYPQVYAKGRLVGGLDIIKELQDGGELASELAQ